MNYIKISVFSLLTLFTLATFSQNEENMGTLKEGMKAPEFVGINQNENQVTLSTYSGKRLILYFYPKDNTPGCTAQACNLNDNLGVLTQKGFAVVGVSPDAPTSHQNFIAKFNLGFDLIADSTKEILKAYEAWGTKNMYGKITEGVLRTTYIINEQGIIEKIIKKVDTKNHTQQILDLLEK